MVKRSEIVDLSGLWREGHGRSEKSEALGLSSRVRRAAPSLQMQNDEPVEASCGLAKAAALTILVHDFCVEQSERWRPCTKCGGISVSRGKPFVGLWRRRALGNE